MQTFLFRNAIIQHYRFIIFLSLLLSVGGLIVAMSLPLSLYPSVQSPTIRAEVIFEGSAKTFYEQWGKKLEDSLRAIHGVKYVEAKYSQTKVIYFSHFKWGIDSETAKKEVKMVTSFYRARMPDYLPPIFIYYYDPGTENYLAVKHKTLHGHELSRYIKANLLPQIEALKGVGRAFVSEPGSEFVHVKLDPYKLIKLGIEAEQIIEILHSRRFNFNLGRYKTNKGGEYNVQLTLTNHSQDDIANIQLMTHHMQPVRLADVADISMDYESYERQFSFDDEEVIAVAMWPEPTANLYLTSEAFLQSVKIFFGDDAEIIILNHPNHFIKTSIIYLLYSIVAGILAAALMVLIFYRRLSPMLLISITMPISLGISFVIMKLTGIGINLISLSALSITIGIVVDAAIIVIDNIMRSHRNNVPWQTFVVESTAQVAPSLLASTATSIVVFFPMAFTEPLTASILSQLVYSAVIILCVALFVCLFLVPSIIILMRSEQRLGTYNDQTQQHKTTPRFFSGLGNRVWLIIPIVLIIYAISGYYTYHLLPAIPKEVIAEPKAEIIDINLIFRQEGLSAQEKKALVAPYQAIIKANIDDHIDTIYIDYRRNNTFMSLHLKSYRTVEQDLKTLKALIKETENIAIEIDPWVTSALKVAAEPDIVLLINDPNEDLNRALTESAVGYLKSSDSTSRAKMTPRNEKTQIIDVQLKQMVLNTIADGEQQYYKDKLNVFVRHTVSPQNLYALQLNKVGETPLKLSIGGATQQSYLNVPMRLNGRLLYVDELVADSEVSVWREFLSRNAQITNKIEIWLNDAYRNEAHKAQIVSQVKRHLSEKFDLTLVPLSVDNTSNETKDNIDSLTNALLLSTCLTFLIIYFHYKEFLLSLIVLSVVVFGIFGAILSLYIFESTISLNSLLGMLILIGLVVNNSILITDFYLIRRQESQSVIDAVWHSMASRMKALIVTNMTTLMGMLPLAIGLGAGQDITKPLGIAVAGGLITATVLTIISLPCLLILHGYYKAKPQREVPLLES